MERTVSSFTSEHLQQSLQHCNESISYKESTDYGGRPSATGNGHLPHHRDRCCRWVSTHLQHERTDFQVYGLPLQMCMWFYMTILYLVIQRSFATKDLVCIHFIIHRFMFTRSFASLWMTRQKTDDNDGPRWIGWRVETQTFMYIGNGNISSKQPFTRLEAHRFIRLDAHANASRPVLPYKSLNIN